MKLYAHQKEIIDADPKKCGLFLGTGSGKTRIALALARGTTLVIAPKTQVDDDNWGREWYNILEEQEADRDYMHHFSLNIMTFDKFKAAHETLPAYETVIVDEAHGMLGITPNTRQRKRITIPRASQRFEALEAYLERTNPERLYLCTATIMKSPMTVWGAEKLLRPGTGSIGKFLAFREEFYTRLPMPGREVFAPVSTSYAKDKLAKMVLGLGFVGRLNDFFDVPDQTYRTHHIELTAAQKARIKDMKLEYPEPIVRMGKVLQIENGVLAGDEYTAPESFDNGKIDAILDYALEFPRMVVFARYTAQIEAIQKALTKAKYHTWTLTGDTKDRKGVIRQANELDGVLICQAQISAGWEVPQTPVMIFASRTYSFVDYDQAFGRIQRANNIKKNLYINLVVKGGVDQAVDKSLANKQDFNERLYAGV